MITQEIEELISPTELVQAYGLTPQKTGTGYDWYLCPFHKDKHASMRVFHEKGRGFYCHSCGTGGGVVKFVELYFKLSNKDACLKIIRDFNLDILDKTKKKSTSMLDKIKRCRNQIEPLSNYMKQLKHYVWENYPGKFTEQQYKTVCHYTYMVTKYQDKHTQQKDLIKDIVAVYNFAKSTGRKG